MRGSSGGLARLVLGFIEGKKGRVRIWGDDI